MRNNKVEVDAPITSVDYIIVAKKIKKIKIIFQSWRGKFYDVV